MMKLAAMLVWVLPSVLHGSTEGQLRGSSSPKDVSDSNSTSPSATTSYDMHAMLGPGEEFHYKLAPNYCLSVQDNSFRNGQNLQLWTCSKSPGQMFTWNNDMIQLVSGGYKFCVVIDGNHPHDGANIQLWECDDKNVAMRWSPPLYGDGMLVNFNEKCMVVEKNLVHDGANVVLGSCHGPNAQYNHWRMGH
jgi:hypothetical protein